MKERHNPQLIFDRKSPEQLKKFYTRLEKHQELKNGKRK